MTKTLYVPEHIKNRKTAPPPSKSDSLDEVYERIDKERIYVRDALEVSDDDLTNTNISVISNSKNKVEQDMWFELKKDANQRNKTILRRQSKFSEIRKGISIKMEVTGYTAITVGDMIFVNLQSIGGDDSDPDNNKFYSGLYLIQTLRHKFSYPTKTHTMGMTVVKDGLPVTVTIPSVAKNRIAVFKFIGLSAVILTVPAVADTVRSMVSSMVLSATMETVAVDTIPK